MNITNTIGMLRRRSFTGMLLGTILLVQSASAQIWSTAGTACVPDDTSAGLYHFTSGTVSISPAAPLVAQVKLRCNITSPMDFLVPPAWPQMFVGGSAGIPTHTVQVQLFQVSKLTGVVAPISNFVATGPWTGIGVAPVAAPFNFAANVYYVAITLSRTAGGGSPTVWFVSLD